MSTLTPDDFTDDERSAIEFRLSESAADIARLQANITRSASMFNNVADFDSANQRVQDAAIAQLVTILYQIIVDRDDDDPTNAPHYIEFFAPSASEASFPVTLPTLSAADDLPTYLAAISGYVVPFATASVAAGNADVPTGGWELWRTVLLVPERDPDQPDAGELTLDYPTLIQEFDERNEERLDPAMGSYVFKLMAFNSASYDAVLLDILEQRQEFWESLGFSGG